MSLPLRKARWIEKDDLHCHSSSLAKIVPVIILARFLLCLLPFHSICPFFLKSYLRYRRVILFFSFFPLFLPDTWRKERINGDPRGGCQFRWMDGRNKRMPRFIGCVRESDDRLEWGWRDATVKGVVRSSAKKHPFNERLQVPADVTSFSSIESNVGNVG